MTIRKPRCWITIGGALVTCSSTHVTRKSVRSSDEFTADTTFKRLQAAGIGIAQVAEWQPQDVSVINSTDGNQVTMITGTVDVPEIDWNQNKVSFKGRDKSAKLVEKRASKSYKNMQSSEIVQQIAQDNGLQANVQSGQGSSFAGKIYYQDTVHLLMHKTYHELLSDLAQREGNQWFVDGDTLYFQPKDQGSSVFSGYWCPPGVTAPYGWATVLTLETSRNMTAAKPHKVSVKSLHHKDKKQYEGKAEAGGDGDDTVTIEDHHNGNNQAQVDALAKARLRDAIRHDCQCTFSAPANLNITPQYKFQLGGTGTIYDQTYDIDSLEIEIDWDTGALMTGQCKAPKAGRDDSSGGGSSSSSSGGTAAKAGTIETGEVSDAGPVPDDGAAAEVDPPAAAATPAPSGDAGTGASAGGGTGGTTIDEGAVST